MAETAGRPPVRAGAGAAIGGCFLSYFLKLGLDFFHVLVGGGDSFWLGLGDASEGAERGNWGDRVGWDGGSVFDGGGEGVWGESEEGGDGAAAVGGEGGGASEGSPHGARVWGEIGGGEQRGSEGGATHESAGRRWR